MPTYNVFEVNFGGGSGDLDLITGSFIRLYDLYHYEVTAAFIATVPAEVVLTDDVENNRIIGFIYC